MPSQEAFDAMNDAEFTDWWDQRMMAACQDATDECEVEAADAERRAAWDARWAA